MAKGHNVSTKVGHNSANSERIGKRHLATKSIERVAPRDIYNGNVLNLQRADK